MRWDKRQINKGDRGLWGRELCPREGALKVERFPHTRKPPHRRGQGELQNLRGKCGQTGALQEDGENPPQRWCERHLPAKQWLTCPRPPTGNGGWVGGEDQGVLPGRYPEVAHMTQNKDPALENAEAGQAFFGLEPQRQRSRQEDQRPKVGATMGSTPDTSTAAELWAAGGFLGAWAAQLCQGCHNPGSPPREKRTACLRLRQTPAGPSHSEHSPLTPAASAVTLPLLSTA